MTVPTYELIAHVCAIMNSTKNITVQASVFCGCGISIIIHIFVAGKSSHILIKCLI